MSNNNLQRGQNMKRQQRQAQQFHERLINQKNRGTRRGRGNSATVRSAIGGLPGGPAA